MLYIKILIFFISVLSVILNFIKESTSKKTKIFKSISKWLIVLSIGGLIATSVIDTLNQKNNEQQEKKLNVNLDSTRLVLKTTINKLDSLKTRYDSISIADKLLLSLLNITRNDITIMKTSNDTGFSQNIKSIEKIGQIAGTRSITLDNKTKMVTLLLPVRGNVHFVLFSEDSEVINFAEQLKEIFSQANWRVTKNNTYITTTLTPFHGIQIGIKKASTYPPGLENVVKALDLAGIEYNLFYYDESSTELPEFIYFNMGIK